MAKEDFRTIFGITDELADVLIANGIDTLEHLAKTQKASLREILTAASKKIPDNIDRWPQEAMYIIQNRSNPSYVSATGIGASSSSSSGSTGSSGGGDTGTGAGSSGGGDTGTGAGSSGSGGGIAATPPHIPPARESWDGYRRSREPIVFEDMHQRNLEERDRLLNERFTLRRRKDDLEGKLPPLLQERLDRISLTLFNKLDKETQEDEPVDPNRLLDPLYKAIQEEFARTHQPIGDHRQGKLPSQQGQRPETRLTSDEIAFAAVYGIMEREHTTDPKLGPRFANALALARGEFNGRAELFENVLDFLIEEGDLRDPNHMGKFVNAEQWASVVRILVTQGVRADDIHLGLKTRQALASQVVVDDDAPPSSLAIDLPDLEEQANVEIVEDNLHAMQAIYFAAMLEELKLFQVVEKLVELFQIGMLPLGKGRAGDILFRYMKKSVTRFSEYERRNLYARTLGFAGGEAGGNPNRDFQMLWLRFVSAVSSFARQMQVDSLLRANIPVRVSQEQVRKSGRDLAANLSLYGYGMAYFAATELQNQINEIIALLSDSEIKGAYGARDMWGVIDQVAAFELNGPRDSIRYRTMATSGAVIIRWLAKKAKELASVNMIDVLDTHEISRPSIHPPGSKPTTNPSDSDLVNACERWLAVTGTPDIQVENYAEAYEGPTTTSRPIQIPSAAREMLQSVGINASANGFGR